MNIKNLILGKPIKNNQLSHEKLSKLWGIVINKSAKNQLNSFALFWNLSL